MSIISLINNSKRNDIIKAFETDYNEFSKLNMATKAEGANKLFIENKILIQAGEIALDTIDR